MHLFKSSSSLSVFCRHDDTRTWLRLSVAHSHSAKAQEGIIAFVLYKLKFETRFVSHKSRTYIAAVMAGHEVSKEALSIAMTPIQLFQTTDPAGVSLQHAFLLDFSGIQYSCFCQS